MRKILVMASGSGTNFEALAKACLSKKVPNAQVVGLITDKKDCGALDKASQLEVPAEEILPGEYASKKDYEAFLMERVREYEPDFIYLAGFMRILSKEFIQSFFDAPRGISKIVNIHPSLLPAFPGRESYQQALDYGVKIAGCTLHFVNEEVDSGPIIMQKAFSLDLTEDPEEVKTRGKSLEWAVAIQGFKYLCQNAFEVYSLPNGRQGIRLIR
jgi:phosphoribosylglycinamide formyltransferase-1